MQSRLDLFMSSWHEDRGRVMRESLGNAQMWSFSFSQVFASPFYTGVCVDWAKFWMSTRSLHMIQHRSSMLVHQKCGV